jgi:hypothetical protein
LAHVLRAAAKIANDPNILVVGSQAILGSHAEDELPEVAWMSVEADLAFFDDKTNPSKSDEVDGEILRVRAFVFGREPLRGQGRPASPPTSLSTSLP